MSLYNNIADKLASDGLMGSIRGGLNTAFGGVADAATQALGGGALVKAIGTMGQDMAVSAGMGVVNKYVPVQAQRIADVGAGAVRDLMNGDWNAAGLGVMNSGILRPYLSGLFSQAAYWGTPTPLLGGISPAEARQIHEDMGSQKLAHKNLWLLEVTSWLEGGVKNMPDRFNLFATEVDYAPFTVTADKRRVGGAVVDAVQGGEPVELRMTTMDDQAGSIKHWFAAHYGEVCARDGTVGVPANYAITIKVVHAFITQASNRGGYEDIGLFRPANLEVSLSRREDGLQELQMTFSQLDTFMKP